MMATYHEVVIIPVRLSHVVQFLELIHLQCEVVAILVEITSSGRCVGFVFVMAAADPLWCTLFG